MLINKMHRKFQIFIVGAFIFLVGLPASAVQSRVINFSLGKAILDPSAGQYLAVNYTVANPGDLTFKIYKLDSASGNKKPLLVKKISGLSFSDQASGVIRINANNKSVFGQKPGGNYGIVLNSGNGAADSKQLGFAILATVSPDEELVKYSAAGTNYKSGDTIYLRQDSKNENGLTVSYRFEKGIDAQETYLVLGNKELKFPNSRMVTFPADRLPAGHYKAFVRGYAFEGVKKIKKVIVNSKDFVDLWVLARPALAKYAIVSGSAKQSGVKPENCERTIATTKTAESLNFNFSASNLTQLLVRLSGVDGDHDFEVLKPNLENQNVSVNPDCLVPGRYATKIIYKNTDNFSLEASLPDVVIRP